MPTLVSLGGNSTDASSWALAASEVDSEAATLATSTAGATTPSFTPGAITIDGILLKVSSASTSSLGTFSAELRQTTGNVLVAGTTVTLTKADYLGYSGWLLFKFDAPVTLVGGTGYGVRVFSSVNTSMTFFRSGTANDFARCLRTTTTAAPTAGDKLIVVGEHTNSGTVNPVTITWTDTADTQFGAVAFPQSISVNGGGTLRASTAGASNWTLRWRGVLRINSFATFEIGTPADPIPASSTFSLLADGVANVDSGIQCTGFGSTFTMQGAYKLPWTRLNADAAINATSITVESTEGWQADDFLCISSTTRTPAESANLLVDSIASSTVVNLNGWTAFAYAGVDAGEDGDIRAYVGNLTRNVRFFGNSTTIQGYLLINAGAVFIDSVGFNFLGSNTLSRRGIDILGLTNCTISNCAMYSYMVSGSQGLYVGANTSGTVSNNVTFGIQSNAITTLSNNLTVVYDNNLIMRTVTSHGFNIADHTSTYTNNVVTSNQAGGNVGGFALSGTGNIVLANFSGNVSFCNSYGILCGQGGYAGTIDNCKFIRNLNGGIYFLVGAASLELAVMDNCDFISNAMRAFVHAGFGTLSLNNCRMPGGVAPFTQPLGIDLGVTAASSLCNIEVRDCQIGTATQPIATGIRCNFTTNGLLQVKLRLINSPIVHSTTAISQAERLGSYGEITQDVADYFEGIPLHARYANGFVSYSAAVNGEAVSGYLTEDYPEALLYFNPSSSDKLHELVNVPVTAGQSLSLSFTYRKSRSSDTLGMIYNADIDFVVKPDSWIGVTDVPVIVNLPAEGGAEATAGQWLTATGTTPVFTRDGTATICVRFGAGSPGILWLTKIASSSLGLENDMTKWQYGMPLPSLWKPISGGPVVPSGFPLSRVVQ